MCFVDGAFLNKKLLGSFFVSMKVQCKENEKSMALRFAEPFSDR